MNTAARFWSKVGRNGSRFCRTCAREKGQRERQLHPDRVRARQDRYLARKRAQQTPVSNTAGRTNAA